MDQTVKLHIVPAGDAAADAAHADTRPMPQAQVHAAAVARLLKEVKKLRHNEAILATDQLADIERETQELAELNAKAEQRIQSIANAHIEDERALFAERNSRAIAEARVRVALRQRIAEEQRLQQLAQKHAELEAEAARLAQRRGDTEAEAIDRDLARCHAEKNLAASAKRKLELASAAAAIAEANLHLEREAMQSAQERLAAEKREHDALAKKLEFEQRSAHESMQRAKAEALLALEAKRRADADAAAAASLAERIAAEHEAAELAKQQASAEANLALASTARRDERRVRLQAVADLQGAEKWAQGDASAINPANEELEPGLHAPRGTLPAPHGSLPPFGRRSVRGRHALAFGVIALTTAMAVSLLIWYKDASEFHALVNAAGSTRAAATPISAMRDSARLEQIESGLPGMKMSDRLSESP